MARLIKKINSFKDGMNPFPSADGIFKIEHFDTMLDRLKPYRGLETKDDDTSTYSAIHKILVANNVTGATSGSNMFALARVFGGLRFGIVEWDISQQKWSNFKGSGADSSYSYLFHYYKGKFIGLTNGTHIWTITSAAVNLSAVALTYTTAVDIMTHSKDNLCYIATINSAGSTIISSYDGSSVTTGLTIANFTCTSISEHGDYIMVVGYEKESNRSIAYLWDRDSSLATLTSKYDIGYIQTRHNATLDGVNFIISNSWTSANTPFTGENTLHIGYVTQDRYITINKYRFTSITIGEKYKEGNNFYFLATVTYLGSSTSHNVLFRLDPKGRLFVEQSLEASDTDGFTVNCAIKDGDGFWFGISHPTSTAYISYVSKTTYDTTSYVEFNGDVAKDEFNNLDTLGGILEFEPLPSAGSVVVKTKADSESSWTTVRTFDTDNALKGSFNGKDANGNNFATAKVRYWRIESTGGAVIKSFRRDYEEINNEAI